jgi:predicted DCC family thiol-disulfide oxidoreductase YuxK
VKEMTDILLLDSECGLCSKAGNFISNRIINHDALQIRSIHDLSGEKLILEMPMSLQELDTMYLIKEKKVYIGSGAAIRTLLYLPLRYRILFPFLWIIPLPIRGLTYKLIAKNRKKWDFLRKKGP